MKTLNAFIAAALIAVASLTGCNGETDSARLVVTYATLKVIEKGDTHDEQIARAERIRTVATDVQALLAGESVTVALLQSAVRAKLDTLNLTPADRFLAEELLRLVVQELEERVGSGVLDPDKRLKVETVLRWVLDATALAA